MELRPFSPKQRTALKWWCDPGFRDYDAIICDGAVRSGKTLAMSFGFVLWGLGCFSSGNLALCGRTITSLERNVVRPLCALLREAQFSVREVLSKRYFEVECCGRFCRFYLFGGKDEGSAALIQGMTLCGVLFDEVALMPRSFVEQAIARCSVSGGKLWFNCNPEHPYHWFYREWIRKSEEKRALYLHFTMDDNPALPEEVRERYERMYSGVFYDRFIRGLWTVSEGLVYPMFSRQKYVISELPDTFSRYVISCDYGTVNPTSMGLWGEHDGIWYRIREYYYAARREGISRTDEEHYAGLAALAGKLPIDCVVVDPSAASFIACIASHGKFRVCKAQNDVLSGIRRVSDVLSAGKLRFHASCTDILREFTQYCWKENCSGDCPKKENDHAMDDMRYFVTTAMERREGMQFAAFSIRR